MVNRFAQTSLTISANQGDTLKILVENAGREKIGSATYNQPWRNIKVRPF